MGGQIRGNKGIEKWAEAITVRLGGQQAGRQGSGEK